MIPMSVQQVANAVGAVVHGGAGAEPIRRMTHDSRDVSAGDLFIAIRGARFDGHQFLRQAVQAGAAACLCDQRWFDEGGTALPVPVLVVPDTIDALNRLAAYYREHVMSSATVVVAVTGSNGKTTTKYMIDHVLRGSLRGRCAPKSFNNHIGVPLTLLSADADDRYIVVEIGMNAPGEIAALSNVARPDVAVITSIGEAHLLGLGSIDAIAREKASIVRFVRSRGTAIVNIDRPEILPALPAEEKPRLLTFGADAASRLRITRRRGDLDGTTFTLDGRHELELRIPGVHHASNATAAFAVARWFGIAPEDIIDRLRSFRAVDGRTNRLDLGRITLIDDSYNANPASMAAAVDTLASARGSRRVFVMGDMFELGLSSPVHHSAVVRRALDQHIELLVAVGPLSADAARSAINPTGQTRMVICEDATAAAGALLAVLSPGDVVWVKGSRGMQLDQLVGRLQCSLATPAAVA